MSKGNIQALQQFVKSTRIVLFNIPGYHGFNTQKPSSAGIRYEMLVYSFLSDAVLARSDIDLDLYFKELPEVLIEALEDLSSHCPVRDVEESKLSAFVNKFGLTDVIQTTKDRVLG